jgi:hypothetical protein
LFDCQCNEENNDVYIALFGMNINVYDLLSVGSYNPLINEMIKNYHIFNYTQEIIIFIGFRFEFLLNNTKPTIKE